jgi:hypothetical protein
MLSWVSTSDGRSPLPPRCGASAAAAPRRPGRSTGLVRPEGRKLGNTVEPSRRAGRGERPEGRSPRPTAERRPREGTVQPARRPAAWTRRTRLAWRRQPDRPEGRKVERAGRSHAWVGRIDTARRPQRKAAPCGVPQRRDGNGVAALPGEQPSPIEAVYLIGILIGKGAPQSWLMVSPRGPCRVAAAAGAPLRTLTKRAPREERKLDTRPEPGRLPCR